ncbi:MAG: RNA polymerase sigma-70 factor (ECF subfamily) [Oceanicoccus sp.]|jgi:RNA polymerase sigma-70 factor (ECF subfamily)
MEIHNVTKNKIGRSTNFKQFVESKIIENAFPIKAPYLKRPKFQAITESELIMLAKDGDSLSFEQLIKEYSGKLENFIKKNSYDKSYVDDLYQETLLQALIGIKSFNGGSTFSTWLLGIAFNLIRNHYNRSPQYKYNINSDDLLDEHVSDLLNPEQYMEQFDRICELQIQCDKLPSRSRDVLSLYVFEGDSYEQISEKIGESVSAVKSRLFRSRVKIREALEPYL